MVIPLLAAAGPIIGLISFGFKALEAKRKFQACCFGQIFISWLQEFLEEKQNAERRICLLIDSVRYARDVLEGMEGQSRSGETFGLRIRERDLQELREAVDEVTAFIHGVAMKGNWPNVKQRDIQPHEKYLRTACDAVSRLIIDRISFQRIPPFEFLEDLARACPFQGREDLVNGIIQDSVQSLCDLVDRGASADLVEAALRNGADPNVKQGEYHWTALHHACSRLGNAATEEHKEPLDVVAALLNGGASWVVTTGDRRGETPLDLAGDAFGDVLAKIPDDELPPASMLTAEDVTECQYPGCHNELSTSGHRHHCRRCFLRVCKRHTAKSNPHSDRYVCLCAKCAEHLGPKREGAAHEMQPTGRRPVPPLKTVHVWVLRGTQGSGRLRLAREVSRKLSEDDYPSHRIEVDIPTVADTDIIKHLVATVAGTSGSPVDLRSFLHHVPSIIVLKGLDSVDGIVGHLASLVDVATTALIIIPAVEGSIDLGRLPVNLRPIFETVDVHPPIDIEPLDEESAGRMLGLDDTRVYLRDLLVELCRGLPLALHIARCSMARLREQSVEIDIEDLEKAIENEAERDIGAILRIIATQLVRLPVEEAIRALGDAPFVYEDRDALSRLCNRLHFSDWQDGALCMKNLADAGFLELIKTSDDHTYYRVVPVVWHAFGVETIHLPALSRANHDQQLQPQEVSTYSTIVDICSRQDTAESVRRWNELSSTPAYPAEMSTVEQGDATLGAFILENASTTPIFSVSEGLIETLASAPESPVIRVGGRHVVLSHPWRVKITGKDAITVALMRSLLLVSPPDRHFVLCDRMTESNDGSCVLSFVGPVTSLLEAHHRFLANDNDSVIDFVPQANPNEIALDWLLHSREAMSHLAASFPLLVRDWYNRLLPEDSFVQRDMIDQFLRHRIDPNICVHEARKACEPQAASAPTHPTHGTLILLFSGLVPAFESRSQQQNQKLFDEAVCAIRDEIEKMARAFENVDVKLNLHASYEDIGRILLDKVPTYPAHYTDVILHILCHSEPDGSLDLAHHLRGWEELVTPNLMTQVFCRFAQQNPDRHLRLLCLSMCVGRPIAFQTINQLEMGPFCAVGTGQDETEINDSGSWFVLFYEKLFSKGDDSVLSAFNYTLDLNVHGSVQPFLVHDRQTCDLECITITPPPRMVNKHFRVGPIFGVINVPASVTGAELRDEIRANLVAFNPVVRSADITLTTHGGDSVPDDEPVPEDAGCYKAVAIRVDATGVTDNTTNVTYEFHGYQYLIEEFPLGGTIGNLRDSIHHHLVNVADKEDHYYSWTTPGDIKLSDADADLGHLGAGLPPVLYDPDTAPIIHVAIDYPPSPHQGLGPDGDTAVPLDIECVMKGTQFLLAEFPSNARIGRLKKVIWRHPNIHDMVGGLPETDLVLQYHDGTTMYPLNLLGQVLSIACPGSVELGAMLIHASLLPQTWGSVLARLSGNVVEGMTRVFSPIYTFFGFDVKQTNSLLIRIACPPYREALEALESTEGVEILGYNEGTLVLDRDLSSLCWKVTMSEMDESVICNLFACLPAEPCTVLQHISNECEMWFRGPLAGYIAHKQRTSHGLLRGVTDVKIDAIDVVGISDLTDSERLLVGERILTALVSGNDTEIESIARSDGNVMDFIDIDGSSALHWAAAMDADSAVRCLRDAVGNPDAKTRSGLTPLQVANQLECQIAKSFLTADTIPQIPTPDKDVIEKPTISHNMYQQDTPAPALNYDRNASKKADGGGEPDLIENLTRMISLHQNEPTHLENRAAAYFGLAQYEISLADCERALALDPTFLKAVVRGAKCLAKLGRVDEAIARLLSVSLEDPLVEAVRLKTEGNAAWKAEEYEAAAELYTQALDVLGDVDADERAKILISRAESYHKLGRFEEALADATAAVALDSSLTEAHLRRAMALEGLGRHDEAAEEYGWRDQLQDENDEERYRDAAVLFNGGIDLFRQNRFREAIECYEQCLPVFQALGRRQEGGSVYQNLGLCYSSLGLYQKAIEFLEKHLAIAREVGDRGGEATAYAGLGNVHHALGQYQKSIEYHEKCRVIALSMGDTAIVGKAYQNLGNAWQSIGDYRQAIKNFDFTRCIAVGLGDHVGEAAAHGSLGNAYQSLGQYHRATASYKMSLELARQVGDRTGEGRAYGNLGNAYRSLGQFSEAIANYEKHLAIAREVGDRVGESTTLQNMGSVFVMEGSPERAFDLLLRAKEMYESLWDDLGADETSKITLLEELGKTYGVLQWAQVKAGQHESALETAERGRARTLVDRLSRSDATFRKPLTASAMRSLAESCGTVVVVYSVVYEDKPQPPGTVFAGQDEFVYTWVITPDAITFDRRLPARPLKQLADEVTTLVTPSTCLDVSTSVLTELYDLLIRPIVDLSDVDVITFVPQGPLLFVPFAALHDSETNLDLIDRCVVSISPCVAVLNRAPLLDIDDQDQPRGLTVGNPKPSPLADLMCATAMAISVGHILGLADPEVLQSLVARRPGECDGVLVRDRATKQAVLDRLRRSPRHIMIACHGHQPEETNVHLARGDHESYLLFPNDERLGEREMASLDLRATAVINLSSSSQARGKASVEGALNLSRACIVAGAQSVVAAVTPVAELPTAFLMIRFYQNLSNDDGTTKWRAARALRDAQLWLRSATCGELHDDFAASLVPAFPMRALQSEMRSWLSSEAYAEVIGIDRDVEATERLGYKAFEQAAYWAAFQVMGMY